MRNQIVEIPPLGVWSRALLIAHLGKLGSYEISLFTIGSGRMIRGRMNEDSKWRPLGHLLLTLGKIILPLIILPEITSICHADHDPCESEIRSQWMETLNGV